MKKKLLAILILASTLIASVPVNAAEAVTVTCDVEANYSVCVPKAITLDTTHLDDDTLEGKYVIYLDTFNLSDDQFVYVGIGTGLDTNGDTLNEEGKPWAMEEAFGTTTLTQTGKEPLNVSMWHQGVLTSRKYKTTGQIHIEREEGKKINAAGKWTGTVNFDIKLWSDSERIKRDVNYDALTLDSIKIDFLQGKDFEEGMVIEQDFGVEKPEDNMRNIYLQAQKWCMSPYATMCYYSDSKINKIKDKIGNGEIIVNDNNDDSKMTLFFKKATLEENEDMDKAVKALKEQGNQVISTTPQLTPFNYGGTPVWITPSQKNPKSSSERFEITIDGEDTDEDIVIGLMRPGSLMIPRASVWVTNTATIKAIGYQDMIVEYSYELGPNLPGVSGAESVCVKDDSGNIIYTFQKFEWNGRTVRRVYY